MLTTLKNPAVVPVLLDITLESRHCCTVGPRVRECKVILTMTDSFLLRLKHHKWDWYMYFNYHTEPEVTILSQS